MDSVKLKQEPQEDVPKKAIEKILSWRWVEPKKSVAAAKPSKEESAMEEDGADTQRSRKRQRREREFFVKWKYMNYWHCEWLPEQQLEEHYKHTLRMYWRRMDPNVPPEVDDGSHEDMLTGKIDDKEEKEDDPKNMEQKFYRYGIKPEWMQVHRVINHAAYKNNQYDYLVKWRELLYDQATWERDDLDIAGYQEAVLNYWIHRQRMTGEQIPEFMAEKLTEKQTADLQQKPFEEQHEKRSHSKKNGRSSELKKKYIPQEEIDRIRAEEQQQLQEEQQLAPRSRPNIPKFVESDGDESSDFDEQGSRKKKKAGSKKAAKKLKKDVENNEGGTDTPTKSSSEKKPKPDVYERARALSVNLRKYEPDLQERNGEPFTKCVEFFRPHLKYMNGLVSSGDPLHADAIKYLVKLGNYITKYVANMIKRKEPPSAQKQWHNYLWIFLSQFLKTHHDPDLLLNAYRVAHRIGQTKQKMQKEGKSKGIKKRRQHAIFLLTSILGDLLEAFADYREEDAFNDGFKIAMPKRKRARRLRHLYRLIAQNPLHDFTQPQNVRGRRGLESFLDFAFKTLGGVLNIGRKQGRFPMPQVNKPFLHRQKNGSLKKYLVRIFWSDAETEKECLGCTEEPVLMDDGVTWLIKIQISRRVQRMVGGDEEEGEDQPEDGEEEEEAPMQGAVHLHETIFHEMVHAVQYIYRPAGSHNGPCEEGADGLCRACEQVGHSGFWKRTVLLLQRHFDAKGGQI